MQTPSSPLPDTRCLAGTALAAALRDSRALTLRHLTLWRQVSPEPGLLPLHDQFNPPAWEAGHVAWFQEFWIRRNPQWRRGELADPDCPRHTAHLEAADSLYHSGRIAHDLRWALPLPEPARLQAYLEASLADSLAALPDAAGDDRAHYFHRLVLFHEDMHNEAAIYMANHFGAGWGADTRAFDPVPSPTCAAAGGQLAVPAGDVTLGRRGPGFAFDNELPPREVAVAAFHIDRRLVSVADYWAFVAAGGYHDRRWWTPQAWQFVEQAVGGLPRFHRERAGRVERCRFGRWQALDAAEPMLHVSAHEAEAWCRWARRILPSEAQWLRAARSADGFEWGQGWEWTRDAFNGYPGFSAHPYRDYSQPWFGSHRLLKGASMATQERLRDPAYRNFYLPSRNDIFCGFRSCSGHSPAD